jgi:hypothetical protein
MGSFAFRSAATAGRKKIIDLGSDSTLTLGAQHANTVFLCGAAACAVTLPNANTLPVGWSVKFVINNETAAVTITGTADQCIGHVVTGGDNQRRQLQPTSPINFDKIILTDATLKGDWVEITCITSGLFHVRGDCRVVDKITCTSP